MKSFLSKNGWLLVFFTAFILLVLHTVRLSNIQVDNTSLALIAMILVSPLVTALRRVKIGGFEAEIDPKEVRNLKKEVENSIPDEKTEELGKPPELKEYVRAITLLVRTDHIIALARLRIDLERTVARIYHLAVKEAGEGGGPISLHKLFCELAHREILPRDLCPAIARVIYICNRSLHGEEVRIQDAKLIVKTGVSLLVYLHKFLKYYTPKPYEVIKLSTEELKVYREAQYRVVGVIPDASGPVKNVRHVNYTELQELLDSYRDSGEIFVEINQTR